ncbi:hypothetical protein HK105_204102 [Polyrhizophydium stewartii]|uniref:SCP domain-containing protein n=1 Tax=Polyrhizophydium stewartii TaxID=2732419 RepID=A0ABR4N9X8_9FUNG
MRPAAVLVPPSVLATAASAATSQEPSRGPDDVDAISGTAASIHHRSAGRAAAAGQQTLSAWGTALGATPPTLGEFQQHCLDAHNRFRVMVGVPPLTWSPVLEASAQIWSDFLGMTGGFFHSTGRIGPFGENLYWSSAGAYPCYEGIAAFFNERRYYVGQQIGSPDFASYGHFTQVVWPSTTAVGCAVSNGVLTCEYYPPGNFVGQTAPK